MMQDIQKFVFKDVMNSNTHYFKHFSFTQYAVYQIA